MSTRTCLAALLLVGTLTAGGATASDRCEIVEVSAGCAVPAPPGLRSKLWHQARYHLQFPARRAEVVDGLAATAELSAAERAWVSAQLPNGTYASGAELLGALFPAR